MTTTPGAVNGAVRRWLRVEGLAVLILALLLYARLDYSWVLFALLLLLPDLSFAAYAAGARTGAVVYNIMHSYAIPAVLAIVFLLIDESLAIPLIWIAHIGMDRALGYGLKYPTGFGSTHLGAIGKR